MAPRRYIAGRAGGATVSQRTCTATTRRGEPCRSFAQLDRLSCRAHDPERVAEVREASQRGARNANRLRSLQGRRRKLTTPAALLSFVDGLIWDAIDGKYDPKLVNAVVGAVNVQRALIESSDLERRLSDLEATYANARTRR
jgi:hypothetical protein